MPTPDPRTTYRYSDHFKTTAVRLSELPGMSVRDVAQSLYIHPFKLSRWRKLAREGAIVSKGVEVDQAVAAEFEALREMKRKYERLQVEQPQRNVLEGYVSEGRLSKAAVRAILDQAGRGMRPSNSFRANPLLGSALLRH